MSITLNLADNSENSKFVSRRLAIGAAFLIFILIHFTAYFLAYFFESKFIKKHKIDHLTSRLYLYMIACLLAFNYFQGGIFEALLAWFTLIIIIVLYITVFKKFTNSEVENYLWIGYYILILIYFIGIIINFYSN